MKKYLIVFLLLISLLLSGCGASADPTADDGGHEPTDGQSSEEELISITVPGDCIEGWVSLDNVSEEVYRAAERNEDASVTLSMTPAQYETYLDSLRETAEGRMRKLRETNPGFSAIEHNEEYTSYTVTLDHPELSFSEASSMLLLLETGSRYSGCATGEVKTVHIRYVFEGETVFELDSDELSH